MMSRTLSTLVLVAHGSFSLCAEQYLPTDAPQHVEHHKAPSSNVSRGSFMAFTAKVLKDKVRLRLQPNLDSPIIRELGTHDLVLVVGETEDFYAVAPPTDVKAYVYRTFVLDGIVEGNHVNVRLEPDVSSPVIGQLNSGDPVVGRISSKDKKWIEMEPPHSTHFYISKEYLRKIGDASMISALQKRREEFHHILSTAPQIIQDEFNKPFNQIHLDALIQNLSKIATATSEFPEEAEQAKELISKTEEQYLRRKVADMEAKMLSAAAPVSSTSMPEQIETVHTPNYSQTTIAQINSRNQHWVNAEQKLYEDWQFRNPRGSLDNFYQDLAEDATTLQGVLEPYTRAVKNKPGDFVLLNQSNHLPIAYLYSTRTNLLDKAGQQVVVRVVPRDNNNFAYPAYFVLDVN